MTQRIKSIEETDAPIILKLLYTGFKKLAGKVGISLKVQAHRLSTAWFRNLFGLVIEESETGEKQIPLIAQLRAAQIVELTMSVVYENYRARFSYAPGIESDKFYG